jgi:hypothetical protein
MKINFLKQRLDEWIWWGIISFVAVLMFSIAIVQIIAGLLVVLWIVKIVVTPAYKFVRTPLDYPFIAFVIARIVSVIISVDHVASVPTLYKEIHLLLIIYRLKKKIKLKN